MARQVQLTANEFVNVKDIKENFIYTKDGYLICHIRVHKIPTDLWTKEELKAKTNVLTASFEGDKKDFAYTAYPREIDIDDHKQDVKQRYIREQNIGRKNILSAISAKYNMLATSGENFAHQQYIKLWSYIGRRDLREVKRELLDRARSFVKRYANIGVKAEILDAGELIKLCNLYNNSLQAPFDVPMNEAYEGMIFLNE